MNEAETRKLACAAALLELHAVLPSQARAMAKVAAVVPGAAPPAAPELSQADAQAALTRLHGLDTQAMTGEQARRGAALGAIAAPVLDVGKKLVSGDPVFGARTTAALRSLKGIPVGGPGRLKALAKVPLAAARSLAANAAVGAVTGGALPTIKNEVEREAERGKLKKYIAQGGPSGGIPGA